MSEIILDPERQKKAKIYARIQRRLMLVDLAMGALYVIAWLVFGWSAALKSFLLGWSTNEWLLVAAYGAVFGAGIYLLGLPLSYYSGFVLPHRFDLSNETLKGWISDQVKSILIGGLLGGFLLEVIYALLRASPDLWWLLAAGFMLIFNVLLANLAPVIFPHLQVHASGRRVR
jgi:STE24 endopeptidase